METVNWYITNDITSLELFVLSAHFLDSIFGSFAINTISVMEVENINAHKSLVYHQLYMKNSCRGYQIAGTFNSERNFFLYKNVETSATYTCFCITNVGCCCWGATVVFNPDTLPPTDVIPADV